MNILCTLGSHKWKACKCLNCGKTRNEQHDWSKDCERCARCGATRVSAHKWTGCKCSACGKVRDEGHDWSKDCEKCARCGAARAAAHQWSGCRCSTCGKVRDEGHDWSTDCGKCQICGKTRETEHPWKGNTCQQCGASRDQDPFYESLFQRLDFGSTKQQRTAAFHLGGCCTSRSIRALLSRRDTDDRAIADALKHLREGGQWDELVAAFNEGDEEVQAFVVASLARPADERSPAFLTSSMSNPHATVRAAAIRGISAMPARDALELIAPMLHDSDPRVRSAAVEAVGTLDDARAVSLRKKFDAICETILPCHAERITAQTAPALYSFLLARAERPDPADVLIAELADVSRSPECRAPGTAKAHPASSKTCTDGKSGASETASPVEIPIVLDDQNMADVERGIALREMNRLEESRKVLEISVALRTYVQGRKGFGTQCAISQLGLTLRTMGMQEPAATAHREVFRTRLELYGRSDMRTQESEHLLAETLKQYPLVCQVCGGSGKVGGTYWSSECKNCRGAGTMSGGDQERGLRTKCGACFGTGRRVLRGDGPNHRPVFAEEACDQCRGDGSLVCNETMLKTLDGGPTFQKLVLFPQSHQEVPMDVNVSKIGISGNDTANIWKVVSCSVVEGSVILTVEAPYSGKVATYRLAQRCDAEFDALTKCRQVYLREIGSGPHPHPPRECLVYATGEDRGYTVRLLFKDSAGPIYGFNIAT